MMTGCVVLKMVLMPSSTRLVSLANSGPRWSMSGISIARRTRSGTGVGPGICRKWRPGRREAFCGICRRSFGRCLLVEHDLFGKPVSAFPDHAQKIPAAPVRRQRGGVLIPECSLPVKSLIRRRLCAALMQKGRPDRRPLTVIGALCWAILLGNAGNGEISIFRV